MSALALQRPTQSVGEEIEVPLPAEFELELGGRIQDRVLKLSRWGAQDGRPIIALGGISAGRDICGEQGWWRETIVDAGAVDQNAFALIGFDFAPLSDERVRITPFDQARLILLALDAIGLERADAVIGASYGGMVALAMASLAPQKVGRLCVISAAHKSSAQSLALRGVQRRIVEFAATCFDPSEGLALARQLAMVTYRTPHEFEQRFGAGVNAEGRGRVDDYLIARGRAYAECMPPNRWLSLSESIDRFSIDPSQIVTPTWLVACPDDQLAPIALIEELASSLGDCRGLLRLPSLYGHDAFLKEPGRLAPLIRNFLNQVTL